MIIQDFRMYEYITLIIAAIVFIMFFISFVSNKTPAPIIMLSMIGMYLSSMLSVSSYNVIQMTVLSDGTVVNNLVSEAAFNPMFFSWLFQILYWFFILMFLCGIFFSLVVIINYKRDSKKPKWYKTQENMDRQFN